MSTRFAMLDKELPLPGEVAEPAEGEAAPLPLSKSLWELSRPADDADELLRDRYLCRGGGLLLAGPTGIGKSSLAMQCMILWALGRECFGIRPAGPLKSLLIQAENDDGDLAAMRDGVCRGLGLSDGDTAAAREMVLVATCDTHTGAAFCAEIVEPLLAAHRPDLLWIDPALAYLGGDSNSQKDVGAFLRNGLNPLIHRYQCGAIVVHHTNKPPSGIEKREWSGNELAYLGSGSAEWANWARAVLAVRSLGMHDVFQLALGKRGAKAGWVDDDGAKSYARLIAHSREGGICWRTASAEEAESRTPGRKDEHPAAKILEQFGEAGIDKADLQKRLGWHATTFRKKWKELETGGKIYLNRISGKWQSK